MGARWNHYGFQPYKISLALLIILLLQIHECLSINHEGGDLPIFRSKIAVDPFGALENWNHPNESDPSNCTGVQCVDGKVEDLFKFKSTSAIEGRPVHLGLNLPSFLEPSEVNNMQNSIKFNHRKLLQETINLPAASTMNSLARVVPVPSMGSGSFPAVPKTVSMNLRGHSSGSLLPDYVLPSYIATNDQPFVLDRPGHISTEPILSKRSGNWIYIISLLATLLACAAIISSIVHHRQDGESTTPWKTGLSALLGRALISGVTKLNRLELEVACEDFSNIISTHPECIVFKGTLSSGTEIAVVSTVISSSRDWSKHAELRFREKIDALSNVNHKNFVNLLGYCSEDKPFMRMMVYEYAPNGTLFEHLHVKEFEHLDWATRMRIVMGIAYCLQFMHHELYPPIIIHELQSNSVYLTDDYAAKICDRSTWKEISRERCKSTDHDLDPSESPDICRGSNVRSFGILMLEIISGRLAFSEEHGSILRWATEFLNDKYNIKCLVDRSLKSFKNNELEAICEVIRDCICQDREDRPTMKEVAVRLSNSLGITPDAAVPKLSPLWWAELEILSAEAN
ncbi:putative LRR receptor-like serine/threonine-protein kinase MRH1 [Platanthera guangdongensis]|uniref:LRR receptor-like serine/threonine-protein kinase MRH1 n=1 Tax=Platanthera guangdongensis TaxID=2320717 RepID=A0ABR2N0P5_9ASPA